MNRNQKIVLGIAVVIFVLIGLFPPWQESLSSGKSWVSTGVYRFIGSPPIMALDDTRVDVTILIIQWIILAVAASAVIYLINKGGKK